MSRRKSDAETDARVVHRTDSRGKNRTVTAAPSITKKKTIAITPEAYDELTRRAENAGTDRKTFASHAILDPTTNQDSHENQTPPNLEDQIDRILQLGVDKLEKDFQNGSIKLTVVDLERLDRIKSHREDRKPATSNEPDVLARWNVLKRRRYDSAGGTA
ncbi:MAG: hypothetical protein ACP5E9_09835 [Candidatus Methanospirareceae archaeon]